MDEEFLGELSTLRIGRTGVIIGLSGDLPHQAADEMRRQLEHRYPGVLFTIVSRVASMVTFEYDDMHEGA